MIPAAVVFAYLAVVLDIGLFAGGPVSGTARRRGLLPRRPLARPRRVSAVALRHEHDGVLDPRRVRPRLRQRHRHLRADGVVVGADHSARHCSSIGTRLWALGKRHGFMTPVQMFRDRWECGHIGTVIFAVQAVLLVPYIVIAVMGGGTTLRAVSGGLVPYWLGGAIVSLVVMGYVFFGGMRGTAWVNTFQTMLFLSFGAIAVAVIAPAWADSAQAIEAMLASPATAPLLTRERVSPLYFFSYTFIPLSSIAFPHIGIFCLTATRLAHFRKTVVLYPICMLAIWLPSVFLGVVANRATTCRRSRAKLEARATLAAQGPALPAGRARRAARAAPAATM